MRLSRKRDSLFSNKLLQNWVYTTKTPSKTPQKYQAKYRKNAKQIL